MRILDLVKKYEEFYAPIGRNEDIVELVDMNTEDTLYMPCHCAFNALVLALKDMQYMGHVKIIHKRDTWATGGRYELVYYAEYALCEDGYVHEVGRNGGYTCYAEREKA